MVLPVRRADREGRRDPRRQDQRPGDGAPRHLRQPSLRAPPAIPSIPRSMPAARPAAAPRRSPTACCRSPKAPTRAGRSASRRRGAASTATRPPTAACRSSSGRMPSPATCPLSSKARSRGPSRMRRWRSPRSAGYDPRDPLSLDETVDFIGGDEARRSRAGRSATAPTSTSSRSIPASPPWSPKAVRRLRGRRRPCRAGQARHQARQRELSDAWSRLMMPLNLGDLRGGQGGRPRPPQATTATTFRPNI